MLVGISVSFGIGSAIPTFLQANAAGAFWLALIWTGTQAFATQQAINGLTDGRWEQQDIWNLLSLIPLAAPATSSGGATHAANQVAVRSKSHRL